MNDILSKDTHLFLLYFFPLIQIKYWCHHFWPKPFKNIAP